MLERAPDLHPIVPAIPMLPPFPAFTLRPDVILVDALPLDRPEQWTRLRANPWDATVVAASCCPHGEGTFLMALSAGVQAFVLLEEDGGERLLQAIRSAADGRAFVASRGRRPAQGGGTWSLRGGGPLSPEEVTLLQLFVDGLDDAEIGQRLGLSPFTVKHRLDAVRQRLRLRNRTRLAVWALAHGVVRPPLLGDGTWCSSSLLTPAASG
jgi:DNA-binding NarL/FixJ family response regulator